MADKIEKDADMPHLTPASLPPEAACLVVRLLIDSPLVSQITISEGIGLDGLSVRSRVEFKLSMTLS